MKLCFELHGLEAAVAEKTKLKWQLLASLEGRGQAERKDLCDFNLIRKFRHSSGINRPLTIDNCSTYQELTPANTSALFIKIRVEYRQREDHLL